MNKPDPYLRCLVASRSPRAMLPVYHRDGYIDIFHRSTEQPKWEHCSPLFATHEGGILPDTSLRFTLRHGRQAGCATLAHEGTSKSADLQSTGWERVRQNVGIEEFSSIVLPAFQDTSPGLRRSRSTPISLAADHLKALDGASAVDLGFPYDLYAKEAIRAVPYGGMRGQIIA